MAKSVQPFTWKNGFRQPSSGAPWSTERLHGDSDGDDAYEQSHYVNPPSVEILTSTVHNSLGLNVLRMWPTIYDGTNSPHGIPSWWQPSNEVDVLICGAGPSGLEVALSLIRQGVTFRILDKAETPLIAGRADGVQPRFLEILHSWGLAQEVHEEGPLIERTAIYKDGKKLLFSRSHQSDSRYRGLHIITQGQLERIYIRDLLRHQKLVERSTTITGFEVESDPSAPYPVRTAIENSKTGVKEVIRAKFLVGSDGAASSIRKQLNIPFDGVSTDIYWGIMDCIFETDYPHAWVFGSVISSKHGGCVVIPREDGYIRLYTQLDVSSTGDVAQARQAKDASFAESGGKVDTSSITAEEVLEQANRIFAPYKLKFAAPLSWFAVWKISERVARSFSSADLRVHLAGDAAHVHSVMGAFGLNASIMDAANLAWKIGLCAKDQANLTNLGPTYDRERRLHALRIIHVSGSYLRFICNSIFPLADIKGLGGDLGAAFIDTAPGYSSEPDSQGPNDDLAFLEYFFSNHSQFLLGVDAAYKPSIISPGDAEKDGFQRAIAPLNGVRAPNPRVCFGEGATGYLYDKMTGAAMFHIVIFGSDLQGPVREKVSTFSRALAAPGFFNKFGKSNRFNILLVVKCLPFEAPELLRGRDLAFLRDHATLVFDDRAPDEDAHNCYAVDHARGAVVVVRPDLWVGTSAFPEAVDDVNNYFDGFLVAVGRGAEVNGKVEIIGFREKDVNYST